jgi:cell division protein FtsQ
MTGKTVRWNYVPKILTGLLVGGLISAGVWMWQWTRDPQTLPFHEVKVQGQFQHLNAAQLQQTAAQALHGGFFTVDLAAVRQHLMQTPWVETVSLRRIPGVLLVTVHEYQPVARWNDHYLLNAEQQLMAAPADAPQNLPLLQGPENAYADVFDNYQKIQTLLQPLQLSVTHLQQSARGSWELTLNNGILVTIGRDDVLARMQRLVQWYPTLVGADAANVNHIDLRYENSIAIARKNPV